MSEMQSKIKKCHNCANSLEMHGNLFKCTYCGAEYYITNETDFVTKVEQLKKGIDVLNVKKIINNEFIDYLTNKDELENIIKETICYDLAKKLLNYIELEKEEDPNRYQTVYTAKIRLPKIDYRF